MKIIQSTTSGFASPSLLERAGVRCLWGGLVGLLFFASCSNEDESPSIDSGTPVQFSTQITATPRAAGTAWTNGDNIGVFMMNTGQALSTATPANVKYTTPNGMAWNTTTPIYYPTSSNVDFVAYYPYQSTLTTPYIYKVDVKNQTDSEKIDLLYATKGNVSKSTSPVALAFDHKLSKVVLNITKGTGITDLSNLDITIKGMPTKADFDLADGTLSSASNITDITALAKTAGEKYEAIVIPQAVNAFTSRNMEFTVGGETYNYSIPDADDFESGKEYTYTVSINKTGVAVSKGAITDWTGTSSNTDWGEAFQMPEMVLIPAGTFIMGSPDGTNGTTKEPNRNSDETQHEVTLTKDFYMSKYQITNAQYATFLNAKQSEGVLSYGTSGNYNNAAYITGTTNEPLVRDCSTLSQWGVIHNADDSWSPASGKEKFPVIYVTWYGAEAFATWIGGSLPSEAQWEYACRAGTQTMYSFGADATNINDYCWYGDNNTPSGTKAVGGKLPNPWGLYDMHGNVWEWCGDWYNNKYGSTNATDPAADPIGATTGSSRVLRGGSWNYIAQYCRSAYRDSYGPGNAYGTDGFRVVFVP